MKSDSRRRCPSELAHCAWLLFCSSVFADAVGAQQVITSVPPANVKTSAEISIAINPVNVNNIIAGSLVRGPGLEGSNLTYVSQDGGRTWSHAAVPNSDQRTQGDDVVLFDAAGQCVHAFIAFQGLWEDRPAIASNGIGLTTSADGGRTWSPRTMIIDHLNTKTPFEDKPWLVFDRHRRSPHVGNLYASWTRFDVYDSPDPADKSHIMFSRSTDGGKTFAPPIRISDTPGDCLDDDGTVEGAVPAVGPDGTVYVVWSGPRGLELDKSKDGGVTFGKDRILCETPGGWASEVEGVSRHNGMPVTIVDASRGPSRGTVYVNWIDERHGNKDVFLMSSTDGGDTWTEPRQVNDRVGDNGRDQFFTWMAVDPADGTVNIVYYDRSATIGSRTRLTLARSLDGKTFSYIPVDVPEFDCRADVFFGDYVGIDAFQGRVAIGFMHFPENQEQPSEVQVASAIIDFEPGTQQIIPHGSRFAGPETVTVQHILVGFAGSVPGKDISRSKEESQALAQQLLERAQAGEDFSELVKEFTNDQTPGVYAMSNFSVTSSSDSGKEPTAEQPVFPRAGMVRAFGDVGFALVPGEIGMTEYDATNSPYGWHIIKRLK
ncbi:MAG: peptidylprolyl isomerase [Planctomycetaceae bacterium]|nr:peptidylprolyl isomerase [Planctomycetaceae bacterium]